MANSVEIHAHLRVGDLREVPLHVESARRADVRGIWTTEGKYDAYLQLAAAAPTSGDMQLGTSVALAFNRSPMVTAYMAWILARSSGGRFVLGLGPQVKAHNERRFSVAGDHPRARMVEVVAALRAIWRHWQDRSPLDFHGRFYSFTLMIPFVDPGPIDDPDIPILFGAVGPLMCEAAGEFAEGVTLHPLHSVQYIKELTIPRLQVGSNRRGANGADPRRPVTINAQTFVATGRNDDEIAESRNRVRDTIAFYSSTKAYRPVLDLHGWGEVADRLNLLAREKNWAAMSANVSDDMLDMFAVSGHPEEIADLLHEKYGGVADSVMVYKPYHPADEDIWRRFRLASIPHGRQPSGSS